MKDKGIYILEKLNGLYLPNIFLDDQLKKFSSY